MTAYQITAGLIGLTAASMALWPSLRLKTKPSARSRTETKDHRP